MEKLNTIILDMNELFSTFTVAEVIETHNDITEIKEELLACKSETLHRESIFGVSEDSREVIEFIDAQLVYVYKNLKVVVGTLMCFETKVIEKRRVMGKTVQIGLN